jgi:nitroimidazol reductase NimA-like FMN-containing flavoprotein (pyridoxamine 5'-phosphate oxidase superfamily)
MTDREPASEQPFNDAVPTPWAEARGRLEEAGTYWLATARPDGRPHVMPVLGVRVDGALCFRTGEASRKGKNLASDPRCVITAGSRDLDLVVEGEAAKVRDSARLHLVADAYAPKYGWRVTVRDGAFYADGAPIAGPPPYAVYEVAPTMVFGFGTDETFRSTRWRFQRQLVP